MAADAERDGPLTLRVDESGLVRLTWTAGTQVDGPLAKHAMDLFDGLNAGRVRPLLVDMVGIAGVNREGRLAFTQECSASRVALLGRSPVDRVIANFVLGISVMAMPVRFFTSEPAALEWLSGGEPPA